MVPTMLPSGGLVSGFNPNSGSNAFVDPVLDSMQIIEEKTEPYRVTKDDDALAGLYKMAQQDPSYWEAYLQLLAERENTTNAQKWYEDMSSSQYQRAIQDIQKAGLNPYLAIMQLSGAGAGSVSPAGTWSTSPYSNTIQRENAKINAKNARTQQLQASLKAAGLATTAILAMIAMLA